MHSIADYNYSLIILGMAEIDKQFPYSDTEKAEDTKCESKPKPILQVCLHLAMSGFFTAILFVVCFADRVLCLLITSE